MALLEHGASWRPRSQVSGPDSPATAWPAGLRRAAMLGFGMIVSQMLGCESKVQIASFRCPPSSKASVLGSAGASGATGSAGAAGSAETSASVALPWSTGFESGWCDYEDGEGSCKLSGSGKKKIVADPVHEGDFAAAFTINTANGNGQARCIRSGNMPTAGNYSAWYYVPAQAKTRLLWNLIHFQNNAPKEDFHWDISLLNNDSGALRLEVFSYLFNILPSRPDQSNNPPIPIGSWFHIEMYLKRAADETGEVIVRQDGNIIFQLTNIVTDRSNSAWAQWYVGNLAEDLDPPESTVYVDDVSMSATR